MHHLKNIYRSFTFLLASMSITGFAAPNILFVSDIDDTIKISHVKSESASEIARNAFFNFSSFLGMSDLYNLVNKQEESPLMYYVSNAPQAIMDAPHRKFLKQFQFPQFTNLKTNYGLGDDFKVTTIMNLVDINNADILILLGDNGERDPAIFCELKKELKNRNIKIYSFIHWLYQYAERDTDCNDPLGEKNIPYVTPVEVALELQKVGILPSDQVSAFVNDLVPKILKDAADPTTSKSFPYWQDCKGYHWNPLSSSSSEPINALKNFIDQRCAKNQ